MDPSQPYFPTKNKKKSEKRDCSPGVFLLLLAEFLRTPFSRTITVAASEDEHDETKLLQWHRDRTNVIFEWFILNYFGNPSKWACSKLYVVFFYSKPKVKWGKTKWKISFLYSFWKGRLLSWGRCNCTQCTPSVTSLIFRRTIFLHILTTFIIQNRHKSWIN